MKQHDIENTILSYLYPRFFQDESIDLGNLRMEENWDTNSFEKAEDHLRNRGFIEPISISETVITPLGILYSEEHNITLCEVAEEHQRTRYMILELFKTLFDEKGPHEGYSYCDQISAQIGFNTNLVLANLAVLESTGDVECESDGAWKITHEGINTFESWRQAKSLILQYEVILSLEPHERGRSFQQFFTKLVEMDGWSQVEGLRTANEEIDIIAFREREYYLIECKWEKAPIQAGAIRELYGKVSNRIDVKGIMVSMSGFSSGAIKQVRDYLSNRVIILFGIDDVISIINLQRSFTEILDLKYHELITQGNILKE